MGICQTLSRLSQSLQAGMRKTQLVTKTNDLCMHARPCTVRQQRACSVGAHMVLRKSHVKQGGHCEHKWKAGWLRILTWETLQSRRHAKSTNLQCQQQPSAAPLTACSVVHPWPGPWPPSHPAANSSRQSNLLHSSKVSRDVGGRAGAMHFALGKSNKSHLGCVVRG